MIYIVTALKPEAQAFVDKYKLKKMKHEDITLFCGNNLAVILSGLGVPNSRSATAKIIRDFNPSSDDVFLNIGICGASTKHEIGKLLEIGSIIYEEQLFTLNHLVKNIITCKESEVSENLYEIVDMESYGFYEATTEIKRRYIYKVVSDHFEPHAVTKEQTKRLVFNVIEEVMERINE